MVEKQSKENGKDWTREYSISFWNPAGPFRVKWEVERITGVLLNHRGPDASHLVYSGSNEPPTIGFDLDLSFEDALPEGNWYQLRVRSKVPQAWYGEDEFLRNAERAFQYWSEKLQSHSRSSSPGFSSRLLYGSRVKEALAEEERMASQKEDPAPIRAIQQEILHALRKGKNLRTAHHEGGTHLGFDGKIFFRSDWGVEETFRTFATDEEMLACLREFYDWDSRKEIYPHRPPELDVWKFIRDQMREG